MATLNLPSSTTHRLSFRLRIFPSPLARFFAMVIAFFAMSWM